MKTTRDHAAVVLGVDKLRQLESGGIAVIERKKCFQLRAAVDSVGRAFCRHVKWTVDKCNACRHKVHCRARDLLLAQWELEGDMINMSNVDFAPVTGNVFGPLYTARRFLGYRFKCLRAEMRHHCEGLWLRSAEIAIARDDGEPFDNISLKLCRRELEIVFKLDDVQLREAEPVEIVVDVLKGELHAVVQGPKLDEVLSAYSASIEIGGYVDRRSLRLLLQAIYGEQFGVVITARKAEHSCLITKQLCVQLQPHQVVRLVPGGIQCAM